MKRLIAALALFATAALASACERAAEPAGATATAPPSESADAPAATAEPRAPESPAPPVAGPPAAAGAPSFAVLYPGSSLDEPTVTASGPAGPGGLATYLTDADPETVIAFYRERAEAAGLSSVMAMNQGDARAYGAAASDIGANLQVVASPTDDGQTSVQLSWTSGQ